MLVLLPPSEGKAGAGDGPPLDLAGLDFGGEPGLTEARERVAVALAGLCADDPAKAAEVLGLGPTQAEEVRRNADLWQAATLPAARLYTGVLYEALALDPDDPDPRGRLLVCSGLWGVLGMAAAIPPYRCPIGVALPGVGSLAAHWRAVLGPVLERRCAGHLVVDLRSSGYGAAWRPGREVAERTVAVRVLHERAVRGQVVRGVVSHHNKATKGRLARLLLDLPTDPDRPQDLVEVLRTHADAHGWTVEAARPNRRGAPWVIDLVVTQL